MPVANVTDGNTPGKRGWSEWLAIVFGWLVCAALCLALSVLLESFPAAYDTFLPAIILLLFANIFVFMFIGSRWAGQPVRLYGSVLRICIGEGLLLAGLYVLARFAM